MRDLADHVDALEAQLVRSLARLGTPAELETLEVTPEECERPKAGSRPACVVKDARGRRYFFKSAPVDLVAAEIFAASVRRLGGRAFVATAARQLDLPDLGVVSGMLQPMVEHPGERLPTDPVAWTDVQREVMLREHPWEWLLANLDTHVDQYVLLGPERAPFNIDWDHSLLDLNVEELTRLTSRSPAIPPLRNTLYGAYVRGDVDLHLIGMLAQVRAISRLDDRRLGRMLRAWSAQCGHDPERARAAETAFFRRKEAIGHTFRRFVQDLRAERAAERDPTRARAPLPERARTAVIGAWQRLVIDVLHDRAVVPWLKVYRSVLARREARMGRSPTSDS